MQRGAPCRGPMLRAAQRSRLSAFAAWAELNGMPLTTSESWASWFYYDSPDLDWQWLLEWAEWSVEDAIEYRLWGWTPIIPANLNSPTGVTPAGTGG